VTLAATLTIAAARQVFTEKFRQAGIDSAETDARLLVAHALRIDRAELERFVRESTAAAHA